MSHDEFIANARDARDAARQDVEISLARYHSAARRFANVDARAMAVAPGASVPTLKGIVEACDAAIALGDAAAQLKAYRDAYVSAWGVWWGESCGNWAAVSS